MTIVKDKKAIKPVISALTLRKQTGKSIPK